MLLIDVLLFSYYGLIVWFVQMAWIPFWAAGVINGLGHYIGYRNFSTPDTSTNLSPIGFYIGGEELHNNHHAFPRSSKFSLRPCEFDIGWLYIRIFSFFGLAKVLERAPQIENNESKFTFGTSSNLFSNKMRSIRNYENNVISKILKQEFNNINLKSINLSMLSNYMIKPKFLNINEEASSNILNIIKSNGSLDVIYNFKLSLENVWHGVGLSIQERMDIAKEWCKKARETNIQQLSIFADYLEKKFSL